MRQHSIYVLESLCQQLLLHSQELEKSVVQKEVDPDQWLDLLEKREKVMEQMSVAMSAGAVFLDEWKQRYLQPIAEINQRLIPAMEDRKKQLSNKLAQIKRGKMANKQYQGYGTAAYGAFFDTRK